jgi:hypothetical protein
VNIDELRKIIELLDNRVGGGITYIALFSDHSGFIYDNMYEKKLGEFNNPEEMMDLVAEIMK